MDVLSLNPKEQVENKVSALLVRISTTKSTFKLTEFITKDTPYRNNIGTILINRGLVKQVSRGVYVREDFTVNDALINTVIDDCRASSRTSNSSKPVTKPEQAPIEHPVNKTIERIIEKPIIVNPFGFDFFTEIMITEGAIRIGDYVLTGTFTIKRQVKE